MGANDEPPEWDISFLVESEDSEKVKKSLDDGLMRSKAIEQKYKGRIKDLSPLELCEMLEEMDEAQMNFNHLAGYAFVRHNQDVTNAEGKEIFEYSMKISSDFSSSLIFYDVELAKTLVDRPELVNDPALEEYKHALEKVRDRGKYLLSEHDEQLILEKDLYGINSWFSLFQRLRSTKKYKVVIDGEEKEMVFSELINIAESNPDRDTRKAATEAYYNGVVNDKLAYATAMTCIFGDFLKQTNRRGHPSVLTQSLLSNDIAQETLDALISSIKKRTDVIRRFLKLRAKAMGLKKLSGCDISPIHLAPLGHAQSDIPWSKAKQLVIDSYTAFDKESGEHINSLFEQQRIDATLRSSKSASLFSYSFPKLRSSLVMFGYGGSLNDVSTLAHECGHGLHGYFTSKKHKSINFLPGSCLAETGSIFGEMLLVDKLLAESDDEDTKFGVLDRVLCSVYMMVFYMLNDYLFEHSVFSAMQNNELVDAAKLDSLWKTARTEVFGDSVDWLPRMEQWWVAPIHHYFTNSRFYNYPYSFAQLLVLVLYQLYTKEGESFVPKMKRILSAGGSESPKNLLAEVGLNITDPKFWDIGFNLIEKYLGEYEQIVKKRG